MTDLSTHSDVKALEEAFQLFTRTTQTMEEAYRRLEARVRELDQELADKNRQLALTIDYLECIMGSMSDGVIAVDTEGVVTRCNRAASAVLGYESGEVEGMPFRGFFGRDFPSLPGRRLMGLRAKNGKTVRVSERDSSMFDRTGNRIGSVKVFQDLSELEALREQVRQKDRLAAVGEMAATVAHEIRNPLGGIRGFAALLDRDVPPDDPRSRLVQKILAGAKELDGVISELLEYTRPVEIRPRTTYCADLVDTAIGYLNAGNRSVAVHNTVDPKLAIVVDPDKMRQVFLNILLNALQSIESEGEIRVEAAPREADVVIAVSDTGCGMSPDQLKQIFSPFYTTKEKGTGLGLAVATKIVEGHGGKLEAESQRGKGSVFRIHLPRTE